MSYKVPIFSNDSLHEPSHLDAQLCRNNLSVFLLGKVFPPCEDLQNLFNTPEKVVSVPHETSQRGTLKVKITRIAKSLTRVIAQAKLGLTCLKGFHL